MNLLTPQRLRVEKDVVTRIPRFLKGRGTVKVSLGQQLSPTDIIATSEMSPGFRIVNLAKYLKVDPTDVKKYLKKSLGHKIYKGELLAEKKTILGGKKNIISPSDGILDFLDPQTGEAKITFMPKKIDLPAGVFGIVEKIDSHRGKIIIKTQGSFVHGVCGTGKVRDGILHMLAKKDELVDKHLISSSDGQILVGGDLLLQEAINSAISVGVSGIITGGINARVYKGMAGGRLSFPNTSDADVGISIVVCEGFGSIPIGADIYEFLSKYNHKFVSIFGREAKVFLPSFDSNGILRIQSTVLPPIKDEASEKLSLHHNHLAELKLGLAVRIVGSLYAGNIGKIVALNKKETVLAAGIKAYMATIETKRHKIQVPVANLEVLDYIL